MLKKVLLTLLLINISACGPYWYKPYGKVFTQLPKGGTPGFNLGWTHGCQSGMGTQFGGAIYMTFYTWSRDPDIIKTYKTPEDIDRIRKRYPKELGKVDWNNPLEVNKNFSDYNNIFWAAHSFCHGYVLGQLQNANMSPPIPSQERINFNNMSIGNVYKIDGRGDGRWGNGYW